MTVKDKPQQPGRSKHWARLIEPDQRCSFRLKQLNPEESSRQLQPLLA